MAPILWSVLATIWLTTEAAQGTCPAHCTCNTTAHYAYCSSVGLEQIPWDLPDPSGLTKLDLRDNQIREVIREIVYSNLQILDLSKNRINMIDNYVLNTLPKLEYLFLQHNQLDRLSSQTFNNLGSLLKLDLSHNQISSLEANMFSDLSELEHLDISGNRIDTIDDEAFAGLKSVKYISLYGNRLSRLSSNWLNSLPSVEVLLLDMNSITSVGTGTFQNLHHLQSLSMEGNGLTDFSEHAFGNGKNSKIPSLQNLSLKQNKLQIIPSNLLVKLPELVTLDLSQNSISLIDPDAFKGLQKLQNLYLNNLPNLKVIRQYAFSELVSLKSVHISSNAKLYKIEPDAFIGTPDLRKVSLRDNALTTLNSNLLDWLELDELDLRQNLWNCDCRLSFLSEVLAYKLNQSQSLHYILNDVKCSTPEKLANKRIVELDGSTCSESDQPLGPEGKKTNNQIIITIICMFVACVVVCLFVIVWRTRNISFNRAESNRPRVPARRLRRNRNHLMVNGNGTYKQGSVLAALNNDSDKVSITESVENSDVFDEELNDNVSETGSTRSGRKVSFSNLVQVRRCSVEYEDES